MPPITLSIMLTWQNMVGWFTNAIPPQPSITQGGLGGVPVRVRDDGSPVYQYQPRLGRKYGKFLISGLSIAFG
jgi:non-lysosomal glucosylceramidase